MLRLAADENFNNNVSEGYYVGNPIWTWFVSKMLVFQQQMTRPYLNGRLKRDEFY
jgi:hypothetical protein